MNPESPLQTCCIIARHNPGKTIQGWQHAEGCPNRTRLTLPETEPQPSDLYYALINRPELVNMAEDLVRERDELRAEVERMLPVVDAAGEWFEATVNPTVSREVSSSKQDRLLDATQSYLEGWTQ